MTANVDQIAVTGHISPSHSMDSIKSAARTRVRAALEDESKYT